MPDEPTPEPLTKAEPVVVGDLADLLIYVGGTLGVLIPDDVAAKVVAAVVAVVLWVQSTWLKRKSVTPETRAVAREHAAYEDGLAAGTAAAAPQATVLQVGAPTAHYHVDVDQPAPTVRRVPRPAAEPPDAGH